jgi:hypothetical protein
MAACTHTNAHSSDHADSGAHVVYCPDCRQITHACFKPLWDQVEKNLEEIRTWGVYFSKADGRRASESAAIQRTVEAVLTNLREAMLMSRIDKNEIIERIAKAFEGRGQKDVAASIRDLKLEMSIHDDQHVESAPKA